MLRLLPAATAFLAVTAVPGLAAAQRIPFERTIQVSDPATLDVATLRGKIEITAGVPGRVVIEGTATVRVGYNVPANALDLARRVAAAPPIEHTGNAIRLRVPADDATRRAVTVSYRVQVPPDTAVETTSESGETTVEGITRSVQVRTQSAAIALRRLSGSTTASTGSGAMVADTQSGDLTVTTGSSSFRGTGIGGSLHVRTQSGEVDAVFTGAGNADVETGSSAIRLRGLRGGLTAKTQSGKVTITGAPGRAWMITTGSSAIDVSLQRAFGLSLDAVSRSGAVVLDDVPVNGSVTKRAVNGSVAGGGARVHLETRSGTIRIRFAGR